MDGQTPPRLHRVFAALSIPDQLTDQIKGLPLTKLDFKNRTHPDDLHITLRFFGDLPWPQVEDLAQRLGGISPPNAFSCVAAGLSFFEGKRQIILHAPITATRKITHLSACVTDVAQDMGLSYPPRQFVPHVTIGRLHRRHNIDVYCKTYGPKVRAEWMVTAFHLMESFAPNHDGHGQTQTPRYRILKTYPLLSYGR